MPTIWNSYSRLETIPVLLVGVERKATIRCRLRYNCWYLDRCIILDADGPLMTSMSKPRSPKSFIIPFYVPSSILAVHPFIPGLYSLLCICLRLVPTCENMKWLDFKDALAQQTAPISPLRGASIGWKTTIQAQRVATPLGRLTSLATIVVEFYTQQPEVPDGGTTKQWSILTNSSPEFAMAISFKTMILSYLISIVWAMSSVSSTMVCM